MKLRLASATLVIGSCVWTAPRPTGPAGPATERQGRGRVRVAPVGRRVRRSLRRVDSRLLTSAGPPDEYAGGVARRAGPSARRGHLRMPLLARSAANPSPVKPSWPRGRWAICARVRSVARTHAGRRRTSRSRRPAPNRQRLARPLNRGRAAARTDDFPRDHFAPVFPLTWSSAPRSTSAHFVIARRPSAEFVTLLATSNRPPKLEPFARSIARAST